MRLKKTAPLGVLKLFSADVVNEQFLRFTAEIFCMVVRLQKIMVAAGAAYKCSARGVCR